MRYTFKHDISGHAADCIQDISVDALATIPRDDCVDLLNEKLPGYWQDHAMAAMANTVQILGVSWIDLNTATSRTGTLPPDPGKPTHGPSSGAACSPAVTMLIHKQTAAARGTRPGRTYLPGALEGDVGPDGSIGTAAANAWSANMNGFRNAVFNFEPIPGEGFPAACRVVHVHKPDPLDPATWTWSSSDVTNFLCDNMVATQRRRQR